ncbi:MAG: sulfate permease, SulP family, partial [Actinomycetota bacterium]|nr:sulfate permease, SulP family [Actinomycetota bacterium]
MADYRGWPTAPNLSTLLSYRRRWLRGDVLAGITVTAYLVPQVMAYATVAGLPPVVGLWTMIPCLALYAVFGSSRVMSIGPESTTALMSAAAVGPLAQGDPQRYAVLSASLAVMVGILGLVAWLLRFGFVADLLSLPVLIGYMAGVAALMVSGQLAKLTGVNVEGEGFVAEVASFAGHLRDADPATLALSVTALGFLFLVSWRWPRAPAPLLTVLLSTVAVALLGLDGHGIKVVGTFDSRPPDLGLPTWSDLMLLAGPAVGVLLVGYTDFILTARAFANESTGQVDANQELFALGTANVAAGVVGGFTISSSGSRTALATTAGAKSQRYSLVAMLWTLAVILALGPLLAKFPTAALGAIVVFAATRLVNVPGFKRLWAFRTSEFLLAIAALAGVLILGILNGVVLAVALSVAEMLRRVARPHDAVVGFVPGLAGMHDVDDYPEASTVPGLVVYRYDSPLFFANADDFRFKALAAVAEFEGTGEVYWLLLNMEANVEVDITALYALESIRSDLAGRGIVL